LPHEPFVAFDIIREHKRLPYAIFESRVTDQGFIVPQLISYAEGPRSIEYVMEFLDVNKSGHGAIDPIEGAVWRVERKGEVDFLSKYVRHDKVDGKYFPENNNGVITWNS
jgi:hypothetical protein